MGVAEGSIMAAIITAHIAHNSSKCGPSQTVRIIHADGPVIGPYMSRAIGTIHAQLRIVITSRPAKAPMCSRARRRSSAVGSERCDTGSYLNPNATSVADGVSGHMMVAESRS